MMTTMYERYKVWLPWRWVPIAMFLAIMYTAAGVFFLERKAKVALAVVTGARVPARSRSYSVPQTAVRGSSEVVEVFGATRPAGSGELREVEETKEAQKARVRARR